MKSYHLHNIGVILVLGAGVVGATSMIVASFIYGGFWSGMMVACIISFMVGLVLIE